MRRTLALCAAVLTALGLVGVAYAAATHFRDVKPVRYDPSKTRLVDAEWLDGIGCPTAAKLSDGSTYTDSACTTGDPPDKANMGLLLAKTGPTPNNAAAFAILRKVKGGTITELGYDIRRGSHCGAGAPRFNVTTQDGTTYFIGCNSPAGAATVGQGWTRLRWGGSTPLLAYGPSGTLVDISHMTVTEVDIAFDEGQDTGPDNSGLAVLDNIDVNGTLVGQGDN
jgi:hypothetical protein